MHPNIYKYGECKKKKNYYTNDNKNICNNFSYISQEIVIKALRIFDFCSKMKSNVIDYKLQMY